MPSTGLSTPKAWRNELGVVEEPRENLWAWRSADHGRPGPSEGLRFGFCEMENQQRAAQGTVRFYACAESELDSQKARTMPLKT